MKQGLAQGKTPISFLMTLVIVVGEVVERINNVLLWVGIRSTESAIFTEAAQKEKSQAKGGHANRDIKEAERTTKGKKEEEAGLAHQGRQGCFTYQSRGETMQKWM